MTVRVTAAVVPTILASKVAQSRRKASGTLNAYDFYLRALSEVHKSEIDRAFPLLAKVVPSGENWSQKVKLSWPVHAPRCFHASTFVLLGTIQCSRL